MRWNRSRSRVRALSAADSRRDAGHRHQRRTADGAAPSNIPDALNQLPMFRGSTSNSTSTTWNTNSPNQGNYLNLRNLGFTRSLVLLDGVRVPATSFNGAVDINTLPQALVERVDVVTGGASAAYGSDAVVGVVNFILNKKFEGVKGTLQGGISSRGDDASWKATVAAGTSFAGGRGHIEVLSITIFPTAFTISTSAKTAATRSPMSAAAPRLRRRDLLERPFSKASTGGTIFNAAAVLSISTSSSPTARCCRGSWPADGWRRRLSSRRQRRLFRRLLADLALAPPNSCSAGCPTT